jgi:hypothetical protein
MAGRLGADIEDRPSDEMAKIASIGLAMSRYLA